MTTLREQMVKCCVCGEFSDHIAIGSTNTFGSADLDTRPPEMLRSTIRYWVQRCPACGYCAADLSEGHDNVSELVISNTYQNIIKNDAMPKTAASFLALSYEKQQQQKFAESAWCAIRAAWMCDDANDNVSAVTCRENAVSMIATANALSQDIADQAGASEAITIDLMRRAGMRRQALELAEKTRVQEIDQTIQEVIDYEIRLINRNDVDGHTISEAFDTE
ncbi:MAG: DUF2225 domain-containing protein [Granulosicoccus sp.]